MKKIFLLLLLLSSVAHVFAGPRMKLLYQNVLLLKQATLLVPPILADPHRMEKLREKGGDAEVKAYLENVAEANRNLRQYMESEFTFCKVEFLMEQREMLSYSTYFQYLRQYPRDKYFVLQFGDAAQYCKGQYEKMSTYDTQFIGIFEPDGCTRVYINIGNVDKMHQDAHASAVITNLQTNLNRYHVLAEKQAKKGKMRRKKVQKDDRTPIDPETVTTLDSHFVSISQLPLADVRDSMLFVNGKYRTVQTTKEMVLFRYFGGPAAPIMGRDATSRRFPSPAEARSFLAYPDARNQLEMLAEIRVPAGTILQVGRSAPLANAEPPCQGGADRILFVSGWRPEWLSGVDDLRTRTHWSPEEWFRDNSRW